MDAVRHMFLIAHLVDQLNFFGNVKKNVATLRIAFGGKLNWKTKINVINWIDSDNKLKIAYDIRKQL